METSYYSPDELAQLSLGSIGVDVRISRKTSFYNRGQIVVGDHVRIDDFCVLSGRIEIGNYVHIASFCALYGSAFGIALRDFVGLSSRVSVYGATDDYSGECLTNPTIPDEFRHVIGGQVLLEKHVIVGSGTVILPNLVVGEGAAIGALSLVQKAIPPWTISLGIPLRILGQRSNQILKLEDRLLTRPSDPSERHLGLR